MTVLIPLLSCNYESAHSNFCQRLFSLEIFPPSSARNPSSGRRMVPSGAPLWERRRAYWQQGSELRMAGHPFPFSCFTPTFSNLWKSLANCIEATRTTSKGESPNITPGNARTHQSSSLGKLKFYAAFETLDLAQEFERYLKSGSGHAFANKHFFMLTRALFDSYVAVPDGARSSLC